MARKTQPVPRNYEEAEKELNDLVAEIESGSVGLEQSLAKYERGRFLLEFCRGVLDKAEKQIEILSKGPDGEIVSREMDRPLADAEPDADPAGEDDDG